MSGIETLPERDGEHAKLSEEHEPTKQNTEQLDEALRQADTEAAAAEDAAAVARARADRLRGRGAVWLAVLLCSAALLATGYMVNVQVADRAEKRAKAEFTAVARQVVVTLMSIDATDPQASVDRIIDNSTGAFLEEFRVATDDFINVAQDAKVTTKATATAAAVESMTQDSATVLVSASSTVTDAEGADEAPGHWRLLVDLQREGDQIKMSKVEFVP